MQQKIQLCSIRTNHCKVGCALPRGCRMPLGLSGQGNIWGITYLYMYSTCMCVKGVRRPGWGMMLRWWRVTRYRREHHELTHSSLRFEWCCMPFLTAPHTGTYCNTLLHTATHCCRRGTTWNETVFNEVSNMGSSLTSRAHNFGINTKSLGLSVKVESNKLQHCCLHWVFDFSLVCVTSGDLTGGSPSTSVTIYTKHVQRRLDGGIVVNVCDRVGDFQSWVRALLARSWRNPGTVHWFPNIGLIKESNTPYIRSMCIWGLISTNGECSSNTRSLNWSALGKLMFERLNGGQNFVLLREDSDNDVCPRQLTK